MKGETLVLSSAIWAIIFIERNGNARRDFGKISEGEDRSHPHVLPLVFAFCYFFTGRHPQPQPHSGLGAVALVSFLSLFAIAVTSFLLVV